MALTTILKRMEKPLTGSKKLYLLKGGHHTLINSLSSLPTYFLSLSTIPTHSKWNEDDPKEYFVKFHLVDLNMVCFPIKLGGLGVIKLTSLNQALLGKSLGRFV